MRNSLNGALFNKMKPVRLATTFSGIGAPEFALRRLGIEYKIMFACDNGGIFVPYDKDKEFDIVNNVW